MTRFQRCATRAARLVLPTALAASLAPWSRAQTDDFYAATSLLPSTLYRFNASTGNTIRIGGITNIEPTDVAMSPSGVLYACTVDELYTVNLANGASTFIGTVSTFFALEGLEFSGTGTLYACNFNGQLMTLDPGTGNAGVPLNFPVIFSGDLAWRSASTMYATIDGANETELYRIDLSGGGNHASLGSIAAGVQFDALDFDGNGNLFAMTPSGDVYAIPNFTTSGAGTFVSTFSQFPLGPLGGMSSAIGACPAINTFCTAGTTSSGCVPSISGTGTPSASLASGFTLSVTAVEAQKQGILFYGIDNSSFAPSPWGGGSSFLCVKPPAQRMGTLSTGGAAACSGSLSIDWNAYMATHPGALGAPLVSGQPVFAQGWFRDPPSPKTTNLTDALSFVVCQ